MSEVLEEEEVPETEVPEAVVSSQGSSGSDSADEAEGSLQALARDLELPVETLRAIDGSEEGQLLLQKVVQQLIAKEAELEEYETTVKDLTQTLSLRQHEGLRVCII